jgi:hypothetical protein
MIRLLAMLIVAGAVVWGAGQFADRLGATPSLPSIDGAHRVLDFVQQVALAAGEGDPLVAAAPAAPRPDTRRVPEPVHEVAEPVAFVPDEPEPQPGIAEAAQRAPLDRDATHTVMFRLDRVMSLAAGREH